MYPSELAEAKSIFDKLNTFLQKQDILFIRRKHFSSLWFEVTLSWIIATFFTALSVVPGHMDILVKMFRW